MTLRLTFGIDPGMAGAIATLIDGEPGPLLDMPLMQVKERNEVDALALSILFRDAMTHHPGATVAACVEQVRAMPNRAGGVVRQMGAQSSFNFGDGFGQVKAVLRTLRIPIAFVEAQVWKRRFGLLGRDKDEARVLAIRRFPSLEPDLRRKKDCGRADAALIALHYESAELRGGVSAPALL